MGDIIYPKGSEWRRWDLHIHTASSYDRDVYKGTDSDDLLCKALCDNNIAAVAITDHFLIDAERISRLRSMAPEITFFPGVELRTNSGGNNLHLILIFDEKRDVHTLANEFSVIMGEKARSKDSNDTIYWPIEDIFEFAKNRNALVSIHAGKKTNGMEKEITGAAPYRDAKKQDVAEGVHFFEVGTLQDIQDYHEHVFKFIEEKPIIMCSDCHDPQEYDARVKEFLWIKAEPTFEGLLQCIYQPNERVFIGATPPALDREKKQKRSIISGISVKQKNEPRHPHYDWLNFDLPLNAGLVAIIGNKGSGKSALSDIIGHMCDCLTMNNASFLSDTRFRKQPHNYANDYEAIITWGDSHQKSALLSSSSQDTTIESAQYLPQKYIEEICNDIDNIFQSEIDKVIFSYVDETERGSASNLSKLVENKSASILANIRKIQDEIDVINTRIINLEERKTNSHRVHIEDSVKSLQETLKRHIASRPSDVPKPEPKETDSDYQTKITESIESYEQEIALVQAKLKYINEKINDIEILLAKVDSLQGDILDLNKDIANIVSKYDLDNIVGFSEQSPRDAIVKNLEMFREEKQRLSGELYGVDVTIEDLQTCNGLFSKLECANKEKELLITTADIGERAYQKFLSDCKEWEIEKLKIEGNPSTEGTLAYFITELSFLNNELDLEHTQAIKERDDKAVELFNAKMKIVLVYEQIYNPIEAEIKKLLGASGEDISFVAEIQLKKEFNIASTLLEFIDKKFAGKYKGVITASSQMDRDIKDTEFDKIKSVLEFVRRVLIVVNEDIDMSSKKITDKRPFYNILYSLDYIDIAFRLKVGGRNLEELSPGERGIVLLVFFLALSKDNSPIIIDQPEDNLDNQSVYDKLVPCICEAKKKRQVIIVTHNPNIAIACDAEQIIYCNIDKTNNSIRYESGAIENQQINKYVVDVLEGTMPAFDLRKRKYVNTQ